MTKKNNNNNQGTNPLKVRIYVRLNYNLSAYLLQNIMIIVYAPCIAGLQHSWVARRQFNTLIPGFRNTPTHTQHNREDGVQIADCRPNLNMEIPIQFLKKQ